MDATWTPHDLPLLTVPCLNGFLLCSDIVIYRGQEYRVLELKYVFAKEESIAVLQPLDDQEAIDDFAVLSVKSVVLSLVSPRMELRIQKLLPRPHDNDFVNQIFWAYSTFKFVLCHAPQKSDQQVYGPMSSILVGDVNETFLFAFGFVGHDRSCRTYAATAEGRQMSSACWDKILGPKWDKIRTNMVAFKVGLWVLFMSFCGFERTCITFGFNANYGFYLVRLFLFCFWKCNYLLKTLKAILNYSILGLPRFLKTVID